MAMDGERAIEMARSEAPDLILMDISLPGLDGWEATRRLKAVPETRAIPLITLTAPAMAGDKAKCLEAGGISPAVGQDPGNFRQIADRPLMATSADTGPTSDLGGFKNRQAERMYGNRYKPVCKYLSN
jgi:CheY-like chemotaxis protein